MKKIIGLILTSAMLIVSLAACQTTSSSSSYAGSPSSPASNSSVASTAAPAASTPNVTASNVAITVISREEGSGTRGAFTELFGVLNSDKVDQTTDRAETTNSTSVMMTSVSGNPDAIGYISLGSLNNTVKAAKIDGVEASVANINNGTYTISRPFNIATKEGASTLAQDFIGFIMSKNGQDIVESSGYIRVEDTGAYSGTKPSGKIVVGGSSSVSPVMEKLVEGYLALNSGADIELQTSDSSTGMNNTIDGVCDIGMASRELKASEHEAGLNDLALAMDGIAVIVNNGSPVSNLTKEQVRQIFTGEITNWSAIN